MKKTMGGVAIMAVAVNLASARAQEAVAPPSGGIGEIIVTAQRRAENVQKAALSIEVFTGDKLASQGITRPDDLTKLGTGLQVGGGSTPLIYVRGVGDLGVTAQANPAVVTSLNGVPISRAQAISGNFFDLERIEVLKGPQGTLYGRNASGGALNMIAALPKLGETSGYVNASAGNYSDLSSEGALNLAAGDKAAFRLAYQVSHRDGYLTDGSDDDKHQSLRLQGLFKPGEDLSIRIGGGYTHLGGKGTGMAIIPTIPGKSAWEGSTSQAASAYFYKLAAQNFAASGGTGVPPALLQDPAAIAIWQNIQSWNVDAQVDYKISDATTLTIIPAFRRYVGQYSIAPSFNFAPGGDGTKGDTSDQSSLEARLSGRTDLLKWVVGAFVFDESQSSGFNVNSGIIQHVHISSNLKTTAYAGFGEVTVNVADAFRVIGGLRYTSDKRGMNNFQKYAISPTVAGSPPLATPCTPSTSMPGTACNLLPAGANYDSSKTFNRATWKVGFEYDLAPQNLLFATVSTGFKAGGFNQAVDTVNPTEALAFNPETITAYTVGLRNRFLNNRLQVNLEGFYWDYRNLQLTSLLLDGSGNVSLATQNAGKARIYGMDLDIVAKPVSGTTLHLGLEYVNSKYEDFSYVQAARFVAPGSTGCNVSSSSQPAGPLGPYVNIDCSGKAMVRSPEWSANVGAEQVFELPGGGNIAAETNLAYAASRYTVSSFVAASRAAPYAIWNANVTYSAPGKRWFLGAYLRNIANSRVYTGGGGDQSSFVAGYVTSSIGAPRTYGARAGIRF